MGIRDDLRVRIPSYFRCPISLDVMKSPVSLCTGVTYDRSSIQLWLDAGNNTCPATMQVLQSKELIPNHTLHRLINVWSSASQLPPPPADSLATSHRRVAELVSQLEIHLQNFQKPQLSLINRILSKLVSFVSEKEENGKFLATAAGKRILPMLVPLVGRVMKDTVVLEKVFVICNVLLKHSGESRSIGKEDYRFVVNCLKIGRFELKFAVVKFLGMIELNSSVIGEDDGVYSEIIELISVSVSDRNLEALEASVCLLMRFVTSPKRNRAKMVKLGGVKVLSKALSEAELSPVLTEKVLKLIEMASCCKEGRIDIVSDHNCVPAIVKKLLKVSSVATEHAVTVLWSLCCLFREKRAVEMAAESNGMAKVLVVLQSNCSPAVRQMCGDLLRVLGCNAKTSSYLSCYDTKTTHIMPF